MRICAMEGQMMRGLTDKPAVKDNFQIESYINGLCDFITTCTAPMTISIQGDWGTGKTSIMQMTRDRLGSNIHKVWFNTWQFSQFNMGEQLPILFMSKLISEIEDGKDASKSKTKEILGNVLRVSAGMIAGHLSNGTMSLDAVGGLLSTDFLSEFEKLKEEFQKLVNAKAKGKNDKVVIFVDDLDRLAPGRAVELLEVLKIFLDCEKCVFVLAIDYGVVSRGVKEKYGNDFGDEKGKSFFDKIIQVPFKMPVANYNISSYVKSCFEEIGISVSDEKIVYYVDLINHSIGNNPRSMKRLFNSYLLLNKITVSDFLNDEKNKSLLFAILCMQSSFENIYNHIVNNRFDVDKKFLQDLLEEKNTLFEELEMDEKQISKFIVFARDLIKLIDSDGKEGIDENELEDFKNVLNFSTITSANVATEQDVNSYEKHYRYKHRDICRNIIQREANARFSNFDFADFYRKSYDIGCWWVYIRNDKGYSRDGGRPIRFGYEICLCPPKSADDKMSTVTFGIYKIDIKREKTLKEDIVALLGDNPFPELGEPDITDNGIYYRDLMPFNADEENEDVYYQMADLFCNQFQKIKQYFV